MVTVPTDESDLSVREKFNHAIGVPNNASEYPIPELYDDENLREKFFQIGLTNTQVKKFMTLPMNFYHH